MNSLTFQQAELYTASASNVIGELFVGHESELAELHIKSYGLLLHHPPTEEILHKELAMQSSVLI